MTLPWFPFYADAYTGDTGHLTCEEHGAYLQLMLAYYRSEKPLPGTDRALASLVKLPVDRWLECKPALAPFFREDGGFWHHDRIEDEIKDRHDKHAKGTAKAKVAAAARHRQAGSKQATSQPQASQNSAHLHLHEHPPSGGVEAPPPKAELQGVGSGIDREFQPDQQTFEDCGMLSAHDIAAEVPKFIDHHLDKGSFSADWQASFRKWLDREIAFRAKHAPKPERAPPRIELNTTPDWDSYCKRFAGGMGWPRGIGPDPDSAACKAPLEILIKYKLRKETAA
jgi:uncharacterized protein YdaU (DUF1376 family)